MRPTEPAPPVIESATIVAIGSELLGVDRLDTNSLRLTEALSREGVRVVAKSVVGDSTEDIASALERACADAPLVLVTGGLGPTEDDRTRIAAARLTGRALEVDEAVLESIRTMYRRRGVEMPAPNRRQAEVLVGGTVLANARGTAPGLRFEHRGSTVFLFPGVPLELDGLIETALRPWLQERSRGQSGTRCEFKLASLPESLVEERLTPLYESFGADQVAVLAKPGEVLIRVDVATSEDAQAAADSIDQALGTAVFARSLDGQPAATLESTVVAALAEAGQTLATAESCTGGLVGQRLTSVPGSSVAYVGGGVTYSNQLKVELLGVEEFMLDEHGAVSEAVALAMASGARTRLGTDWAVSITGVAGPGGGSEHKPVGTVWFGLAGADVQRSSRLLFPGDRERVRQQASQFALDMVRRAVTGVEPLDDSPWQVARPGTEPAR